MALDVESLKYEYINSGKKIKDFIKDKYIEEGEYDSEKFKIEFRKNFEEALLDPEFREKFQTRENSVDLKADKEINDTFELTNENETIAKEIKKETIDLQSIKEEYLNGNKRLKDFINEHNANEHSGYFKFIKKIQESLTDYEFLREVVKREKLSDLLGEGHLNKTALRLGAKYHYNDNTYKQNMEYLQKIIEDVSTDPKNISKHFKDTVILSQNPVIILKAVIEEPAIVNIIPQGIINEFIENDPVVAKLIEEEQSKFNASERAKAIDTISHTVKTTKEYANGIKLKAEEMKKAYAVLKLKGKLEDTTDIAQNLSTSSEKIGEADFDKAKKASDDFKNIEEELNQKIVDVEQVQKDLFKSAVSDKVYELIKIEELRKIDAKINAFRDTKVGFIEKLFGKQKYIDARCSNLYQKKRLMNKESKDEAITENPIEELINYANTKRNDTRDT